MMLNLFFAAVLSLIASAGAASAHMPDATIGMYTGYTTSIGAAEWGDRTNRSLGSILDVAFVATDGGWSNYHGSTWYLACSQRQPRARQLTVAVGFFPNGANATMAQAASGAYDDHYVSVAQQLNACGYGDSIIRVAWEFNGNWYPWGYATPGTDQANYAANFKSAFSHVVNAFRSVSPNFRFVWNPSQEVGFYPNFKATFPGIYLADIIGADIYDDCNKWDHSTSDPAICWQRVQTFLDDLSSWNSGIGGNGWCCSPRPLALPEWGAGDTPIGDNPYYINRVADWVEQQSQKWWGFAYAAYWGGGTGGPYVGDLAQYPKQYGAFVARFGGAGP